MTGTYISATAAPLSDELKGLLKMMGPLAGRKVSANKLHATVIYSLAKINEEVVNAVLGQTSGKFEAEVVGAACFDALPNADGTRDGEVSTIVLKVSSPLLYALHRTFLLLGGTHTYPSYEPHVSVWYGVPKLLARSAVDAFNKALTSTMATRPMITFTKLETAPIEENWVISNIKNR